MAGESGDLRHDGRGVQVVACDEKMVALKVGGRDAR